MDKIDRPLYNVKEVYLECIQSMRGNRKEKFERYLNFVIEYSEIFEKHMLLGKSLNIIPMNTVGEISKNEFEKIYTQKFTNKNHECRKYYDDILMLANHGMCPYCSQNLVSTIDHFLPRSKYLPLSVTPSNLVPCCSDCNKNKSDKCGDRAENSLFSPYFDDINRSIWLKGILHHENSKDLIMTFIIDYNTIDVLFGKRLENYFETFKLYNLYSKYASIEVNKRSYQFREIFERGGIDELNEFFQNEINSMCFVEEKENLNSWKSALLRTLKEDKWYLEYYLPNYNTF